MGGLLLFWIMNVNNGFAWLTIELGWKWKEDYGDYLVTVVSQGKSMTRILCFIPTIISHHQPTTFLLLQPSLGIVSIAQWESVLVVGGQQFAQIGNYFPLWKDLLLSISPSKHNRFKIPNKTKSLKSCKEVELKLKRWMVIKDDW